MSNQSGIADVIDGAIAGLVATWVMGRVTTALYAREDKQAKQREEGARGGSTAYATAAEKVADAAGVQLSSDEKKRYGEDIHWALGIAGGAAFGLLRPRVSASRLGNGLLFGAAFFLVMDEAATPLLGLTPGPAAFPWQTHARGLAGHLAYGAAANAALAVLQPMA